MQGQKGQIKQKEKSRMLTKMEVEEFKKLVLEIYGIELTEEEANEQGSRLIKVFELILKSQQKVNVV